MTRARAACRAGLAAWAVGLAAWTFNASAAPADSPPAGTAGRPEPAAGASGRQAPPTPPRWTAGIATMASRSPYAGDDTQVRGFPSLSYRGDRFSLLGLTAAYRLTPAGQEPRLSALAHYRFSPYDADDSPELDGMHTRGATLDAGLKATWAVAGPLELELEAVTDTLSRHDGQRLGLSLGRRQRSGPWMWRPAIGVEWYSANLTRFLYGVGPGEATPERPAFEPDDAWRAGGNVMITRTFATSWAVNLISGAGVLDSGVDESPIVDKTVLWNSILSVGYQF